MNAKRFGLRTWNFCRSRLSGAFIDAHGWTPALVATVLVAMVALVFAHYPIGQDSDGLLQTIIPLQKMTVFFWGQDRFANLLPALTLAIRDPETNAIAQLSMRVVCGLLSPLFFCALVFERAGASATWWATMLSSALLMAFGPQRTITEAVIEASPDGTSFALAGFALLAFSRARRMVDPPGQRTVLRVAGLAATCAAYAVNASLVLVAVPLVAGEFLLFGSLLALDFAVASVFAGAVTAMLVTIGAAGAPATPTGFGETSIGLVYFGGQMLSKPGRFIWVVAAASFATLIALRFGRPGRETADQLRRAGVLAASFAISFVAVALSSWVVLNYLHPRYLVPDYILIASLGGTSLVHLARITVRSRTNWSAAMLAAAACLYWSRTGARGCPMPTAARSWRPTSKRWRRPSRGPSPNARPTGSPAISGTYGRRFSNSEQIAHDLDQPAGRVFGIPTGVTFAVGSSSRGC